MDFLIYAIIIVMVALIVWTFLKKKSTDENGGKIATKYATFDDVKKHLEGFVPVVDPKLKEGYTEKSIENQMAKYLKQRFVEVTPQYTLGGRIPTVIDMDVANGVVGIELKDAKSVVKSNEFNRMKGQIQYYKETRYKDNNIFLLVVGEHEDRENSRLIEVRDFCLKNQIIYGFYELGKGYIKEVDD